MKIGILSQWFAPEPGGAIVPTVLARELTARGHEVRVLTGFPNYPVGEVYSGYQQSWCHHEVIDGSSVHRVPLYPSHNDRAAHRIGNYLSFSSAAAVRARAVLGEVDAAWVYNSPAPVGLVAAWLRRRHGVPYLLHVMDVWPDSVLASGMLPSRLNSIAESGLHRIVNTGYANASTIAVTSPGQADLLRGRGVPSDLLTNIPVWADEDVYYPRTPDRSLLPHSARTAALVVMYAGAIGHVQNLDHAIRAARQAKSANVSLIFVGSGVAEASLKDLAQQIGATNVHFMGRRPPEEMGELAAAADVHLVSLVDSPLMRVTMPSKIPAVLASGRAILAACSGDPAEIISEARAGVVLQPGDPGSMATAMFELASAPQTVEAMGVAARKFYEEQWTRAATVDKVEAALIAIARM